MDGPTVIRDILGLKTTSALMAGTYDIRKHTVH